MRIFLFLVFGLVIGATVGMALQGRRARGWFTAMAVGAAGAMVGGLLGTALGLNAEGTRSGFVVSILGALTWLALYEVLLYRARSRAKRPFTGVERRSPHASSSRSSS